MRLLALPMYGKLGASSRLRVYQFIPDLERVGFDVDVNALLENRYLEALYSRRHAPITVISGYFARLAALLKAGNYNALFIEKETLPWLPAWMESLLLNRNIKLFIDYDDAIFHRYDRHPSPLVRKMFGQKLDRLMQRADLITAGNAYLANRALAAGCRRVERIPTVVDLERYEARDRQTRESEPVVIGWIGSPSTASYLANVLPALNRVASGYAIRCVAVGARQDQLQGTIFETRAWTEQSEVESLHSFDIGIMPLPDEPWERGKCGYKLIQYMACGLPVVASPVGVNKEIVAHGTSGYLADSIDDWVSHLSALVADSKIRKSMGQAGRAEVERFYSLQVQGPRLASLLSELVSSSNGSR